MPIHQRPQRRVRHEVAPHHLASDGGLVRNSPGCHTHHVRIASRIYECPSSASTTGSITGFSQLMGRSPFNRGSEATSPSISRQRGNVGAPTSTLASTSALKCGFLRAFSGEPSPARRKQRRELLIFKRPRSTAVVAARTTLRIRQRCGTFRWSESSGLCCVC